MKYLYWAGGVLITLLVGVFLLQMIASERVEVVELHTLDADGETAITRLWVVDDEGYPYLRAGSGDSSGWLARILDNDSFELTRQGVTQRYEAVLRPDKNARINELMKQKYTWGDAIIGVLVGSREKAIPVELHALD